MLGLAYWGYKKYFPAKLDQTFVSTEYTVSTWDVSNTINLAGTTQFANAQKLTFVEKGRVTSLNVKIGDMVKKGQVLATISTETLDQEVEAARNGLKKAQRKLEKELKKSDKELDLLTAEIEYQNLLLEQMHLPKTLSLSWEQMKLQLKTLEHELVTLEKELKNLEKDYLLLSGQNMGTQNVDVFLEDGLKKRHKALKNLVNLFRIKAYELEEKVDSYDQLLWITDKYSNSLGELWNSPNNTIYIWAKDQNLLNKAKDQFFVVRSYIDRLHKLYDLWALVPIEKISVDKLVSDSEVFLQLGYDFQKWGKINHSMFLASIETSSLSIQKIQNYAKVYGIDYEDLKDVYEKYYFDAIDAVAKLDDSKITLEKFQKRIEEKKIAIEKQKMIVEEQKLRLTQISMNERLMKIKKKKDLSDAKEKWDELKEHLNEDEDLTAIREQLNEAQLNLTAKLKKYEDYRIIANFDGVVTKLNMQVGDSIGNNIGASQDDAKYIYVETPDLLEVKLEVDQIDIVKINLGMPVQVFVDALPDVQFSWSFAEIDTLSDGNSYKAKVVFKKENADQKILGGMSATIKVIIGEELGALVVPNPAIAENENGEKIVRLQKNADWIDQIVETWLSDDVNTVILSGLNIGDIIKGLYINDTSLQNLGVGPQDDVEMY